MLVGYARSLERETEKEKMTKAIKTIPQKTLAEIEKINPRLAKTAGRYAGNVHGTPAFGMPTVPADTPLADCQRNLAHNDVIKYLEKKEGFDWSLAGVITVARYSDGTMAIVDGQHTALMARLIMPHNTPELPAHIIDIPAGEEKMVPLIFAHKNGVLAKQPSAEDNFWALYLAGDSDAVYYASWLKKANLSCGKVNHNPTVRRNNTKYPTFRKCVDRSGSATVLAAELLSDTFDYRWNDNVFHGMVTLFTIDDEFKEEFEDEDSQKRKEFTEWFTTIIPQVWSISDLRFTQYRNAAKWEYGVAYGLWRAFCVYSKNKKGHKSYPLGVVEAKYEAQVKDTTKDLVDA